jgi:E3 ubiquitin-protein ligase ZNRF1/2
MGIRSSTLIDNHNQIIENNINQQEQNIRRNRVYSTSHIQDNELRPNTILRSYSVSTGSPATSSSSSSQTLINTTLPWLPTSYPVKCPICHHDLNPNDYELHLVICLTRPKLCFNQDVLEEDKGECIICFDDLKQGDMIARLPCLCIYHLSCIQLWFNVNRVCPIHTE